MQEQPLPNIFLNLLPKYFEKACTLQPLLNVFLFSCLKIFKY